MPTYVYGCDTCGHGFEIFQKFQDATLTACPECSARIRRIFQPTGIVFKGSGWYSTDSRASSKAGTANGNGESTGPKAETGEKTDGTAKTNGAAKETSATKETTTTSTAPAKNAD